MDLRFNLQRKSISVVLVDEQGNDRNVIMREMTGKDRDRYISGLGNRTRFDHKGNPIGIKDFEGIQSSLLCLCLYDDQDRPIPKADIEGWPASVQGGLFSVAQDLNGLAGSSEEKLGED